MDPVEIAPPSFACVVAADAARGIGRANDLPWPRLAADVAHFKQVTTATRDPARQNAVIMGRRTWESIPPRYRPLPKRLNIVVSRTTTELAGAAAVVASLPAAIEHAAARAETIYVVGGGAIYAAAIADPRCQIIYYTRIDAEFAADTFFPPFEDRFACEAADPPITDDHLGIRYVIQRWRRRPG